MIVGNGLVANAIKCRSLDSDAVVFFASGVSNSQEKREEEFLKERNLLLDTISTQCHKTFVYFSSCALSGKEESSYFSHKSAMESLIHSKCKQYFIFRLPQAVGVSLNPNTLLNFLSNRIKEEIPFVLWGSVKRNFIDIEDAIRIVGVILEKNDFRNSIINIASPFSIGVEHLVSFLETHFGKKANYTVEQKNDVDNAESHIDIGKMNNIVNVDEFFPKDEETYIKKILNKYY